MHINAATQEVPETFTEIKIPINLMADIVTSNDEHRPLVANRRMAAEVWMEHLWDAALTYLSSSH